MELSNSSVIELFFFKYPNWLKKYNPDEMKTLEAEKLTHAIFIKSKFEKEPS